MSKPLILFGPSPPPYGGVSVFLNNLFLHLRDSNVRLWTYLGKPTADPQVIRINHRRLGVILPLLPQGRNSRIVDLSHFHLEHPHPILLPIWLLAKSVLGFHWYKYILDGSLPARYASFDSPQRFLFRRAVNSVNEFLVVSDELSLWLQQEIGAQQPITVIPCLLNIPENLLTVSISSQSEKKLQELRKHRKTVCSIGTFIPDYGFAHVANAIESLRRKTSEDIALLLLDGAFATDEAYRRDVLNDRSWTTVLTVPNPEVYQILRRCDLFVRAVAAESYGISRVEAIWCGVPVIATNVGETRGMLTYEFGDEKKLAELIQASLLQNVVASEDLRETAALFRTEAHRNLQMFRKTVNVR